MSYYNLATNQVLLRSYEELALLHKRKNAPTESKEELAKTFGMSVDTSLFVILEELIIMYIISHCYL